MWLVRKTQSDTRHRRQIIVIMKLLTENIRSLQTYFAENEAFIVIEDETKEVVFD